MKNMISGLSYGALNASYQVTGPRQSPPAPSASCPSISLQHTHGPVEETPPPPCRRPICQRRGQWEGV